MERRKEERQGCEIESLVLMFGCHFRGWISDCSPKGLCFRPCEGLALEEREPFVLFSDRFGVLHAEVMWRRDEKIGARICSWRTAAISSRIHPYIPRHRLYGNDDRAGADPHGLHSEQ
jgi:hypothetical protein